MFNLKNKQDVKKLQLYLNIMGSFLFIDGIYGAKTEARLKKCVTNDEINIDTEELHYKNFMDIFIDKYKNRPTYNNLKNFRGELNLLIREESNLTTKNTTPHFSGSGGLTLDPGFDLKYQTKEKLFSLYSFLSKDDLNELTKYIGKSIDENTIKNNKKLSSIIIPRDKSLKILPYIAEPYWNELCKRFPDIIKDDVPGCIHTVILSLGYNRGSGNKDLIILNEYINNKEWDKLAVEIKQMQQDHKLENIRNRRVREGEYIEFMLPIEELCKNDNNTIFSPIIIEPKILLNILYKNINIKIDDTDKIEIIIGEKIYEIKNVDV